MSYYTYYVYMTTNQHRTVLYTGMTNNLSRRLDEHYVAALYNQKRFAGRYQAFYLLYYETFKDIRQTIAREKEIKGWSRDKKLVLIRSFNPEMKFLNDVW